MNRLVLRLFSGVFSVVLLLSVFAEVLEIKAVATYSDREDFLWGVNIHSSDYIDYNADPEVYVRQAALLGVDAIRVNVGANIYNFNYTDRIVALCSSYGIKIIACLSLSDQLDYNLSFYETFAKRYNGKNGYGFIDYIEIGGEEEVGLLNKKYPNGSAPNGDSLDHYYISDIIALKNKFESAVDGVKNSGSTAKTVIDFSHLHYAPLLYMYENGLDFDIIGNDWYTNMGDINSVLNPVIEKFPHDILITETNLWSNSETDFENISEYNTLFNYMNTCYKNNRVKGFVFYELMDEPIFENNGTFSPEAHFGLIYSSGNSKAIYTKLQATLQGGNLSNEPILPKETRCVLDLEGTHYSFADNAGWYYHYLGDKHCKINTGVADFSDSQYVSVDIKIGDYTGLWEAAEKYGLVFWFRLSSGEGLYSRMSAASFNLQDLEDVGNGWYNLMLPITDFVRPENGKIDWKQVRSWQFFIENGNDYTVDSLYSMDFYFRNICGVSPMGGIPKNAVTEIDSRGVYNTIGQIFGDVYGRFKNINFASVDLSRVEYIEFDMQVSDFSALNEAINKYKLRLDFSLTSSGEYWRERWACNIFNYGEDIGYGIYHFKIPKSDFSDAGGGGTIDWSGVNSWLLTFENGYGISTGEYCGITMSIKNICGTVESLISDKYHVIDGYITLETCAEVRDFSLEFLSGADIIDGCGLSVLEGVTVTGMKAVISSGKKVFSYANIVVSNDIYPDGYVNADDIAVLKKHLLGVGELTPIQKYALTSSEEISPTIINLVRMKRESLK